MNSISCLEEGGKTNKKSNLVVVAEGSKIGDAHSLAKQVAERSSYFDIKVPYSVIFNVEAPQRILTGYLPSQWAWGL